MNVSRCYCLNALENGAFSFSLCSSNLFKALHSFCWSHWKAFILKPNRIHITEVDCGVAFLRGTLEPPKDVLWYAGRKINLVVSPRPSVSCSMNFVVETLDEKQRLEYHEGRKRKSFHMRHILVWAVEKSVKFLSVVPLSWTCCDHGRLILCTDFLFPFWKLKRNAHSFCLQED